MSRQMRSRRVLIPGLSSVIALLLCGILFIGSSPYTPIVSASEFDTLSVTAKLITPQTTHSPKVLFQQNIHNARQTQQTYQEITALHRVRPDEVYSCPAEFLTYTLYDLRFLHNKMLFAEATVERTGCEFWVITSSGGTTIATYCCSEDTQWIEWQKTLGIPNITVPPPIPT